MQQPLPAAWIHNSHESERLWMLSEDKMSQCARQIVAVVFFFFLQLSFVLNWNILEKQRSLESKQLDLRSLRRIYYTLCHKGNLY